MLGNLKMLLTGDFTNYLGRGGLSGVVVGEIGDFSPEHQSSSWVIAKDNNSHKGEDRRPKNSHHDELSPFQFAWTPRLQDHIASVPPQKGSKSSTVNKNNNTRRDEANDCK